MELLHVLCMTLRPLKRFRAGRGPLVLLNGRGGVLDRRAREVRGESPNGECSIAPPNSLTLSTSSSRSRSAVTRFTECPPVPTSGSPGGGP